MGDTSLVRKDVVGARACLYQALTLSFNLMGWCK
jgi:hypothetical protein